jgi:hypothetical protein
MNSEGQGMNDNILKLLIEEDKESLIWRFEFTSRKISCFLKGGAAVWEVMVPDLAETVPNMPSGDKVYVKLTRNHVAFTKAIGKIFTYEDVKHLIVRVKFYRLIRQDFYQRIMTTLRNYFPMEHTVINPDETSPFAEISIRSGLHLLFRIPGKTILAKEYRVFTADLQRQLKEKARPAVISCSEDEIHIVGDEINLKAITILISALIHHGLLLKEARPVFIHLVMVAHIKDICQRELAILQQTLSPAEKELFAPYIEIFTILQHYGEFHYLSPMQLGLLVTLYDNRKDIYSFPLMIRIPLRSIYICFHAEIRSTLEGTN